MSIIKRQQNHLDWSGRVVELSTLLHEAVRLLQFMVSVDTSQGTEVVLAEHIVRVLHKEGIDAKVYEPQKGRGSLVAHLPGGNRPPLVLLSHLDTAPAGESKWPFPPYSGDLKDGEIRGRGAIDCKGLAVAHLAVLLAINRLGIRLDRDIYLVSSAGEEEGGTVGTAWLLARHPKLRAAEYVLSEGGGFGFETASGRYHLCQVGEKGRLSLSVRSDIPVETILNYARVLVGKIKSLEELPESTELKNKLDLGRILSNTVRNHGSEVIFEILPGTDLERLFEDFTSFIRKQDPNARIVIQEWAEGTISKTDTFLYEALKRETYKIGGAGTVPYITPGYSDNRFFRRQGIKVYGYQPLLPDCKPSWIHGVGERISLSSLQFGIKLLFNIITAAFRV